MSYFDIPGRAAWVGWLFKDWLDAEPRKGAVIVELGVALGRSTAQMARELIDAKRTDVELWAVDTWAGEARNGEQNAQAVEAGGDWSLFVKQCMGNCHEEFEFIRPLRVDTVRAADLFDPRSVDLCILDADHVFDAVRGELLAWIPKVREGGTIGGDDHESDYPGVEQACVATFGRGGYELWRENKWRWTCWRKVLNA